MSEEISKLSALCESKFGDRKPKLDDLRVQEQLNRLFGCAIDLGFARLFSDIAKDKRIVRLNDEVWKSLSKFVRAKRLSVETLGHALIWSSRERNAKSCVDECDAKLKTKLLSRNSNDKVVNWSDIEIRIINININPLLVIAIVTILILIIIIVITITKAKATSTIVSHGC